jgi:hypothetical protein
VVLALEVGRDRRLVGAVGVAQRVDRLQDHLRGGAVAKTVETITSPTAAREEIENSPRTDWRRKTKGGRRIIYLGI